jgi:hypothetical protein
VLAAVQVEAAARQVVDLFLVSPLVVNRPSPPRASASAGPARRGSIGQLVAFQLAALCSSWRAATLA